MTPRKRTYTPTKKAFPPPSPPKHMTPAPPPTKVWGSITLPVKLLPLQSHSEFPLLPTKSTTSNTSTIHPKLTPPRPKANLGTSAWNAFSAQNSDLTTPARTIATTAPTSPFESSFSTSSTQFNSISTSPSVSRRIATLPEPPVAGVIPEGELLAIIETNPVSVFQGIVTIMDTVEYMYQQIESEQFMQKLRDVHEKEVLKISALFEACNISLTTSPEVEKKEYKNQKLDPSARPFEPSGANTYPARVTPRAGSPSSRFREHDSDLTPTPSTIGLTQLDCSHNNYPSTIGFIRPGPSNEEDHDSFRGPSTRSTSPAKSVVSRRGSSPRKSILGYDWDQKTTQITTTGGRQSFSTRGTRTPSPVKLSRAPSPQNYTATQIGTALIHGRKQSREAALTTGRPSVNTLDETNLIREVLSRLSPGFEKWCPIALVNRRGCQVYKCKLDQICLLYNNDRDENAFQCNYRPCRWAHFRMSCEIEVDGGLCWSKDPECASETETSKMIHRQKRAHKDSVSAEEWKDRVELNRLVSLHIIGRYGTGGIGGLPISKWKK